MIRRIIVAVAVIVVCLSAVADGRTSQLPSQTVAGPVRLLRVRSWREVYWIYRPNGVRFAE